MRGAGKGERNDDDINYRTAYQTETDAKFTEKSWNIMTKFKVILIIKMLF